LLLCWLMIAAGCCWAASLECVLVMTRYTSIWLSRALEAGMKTL
jgi:hypothetical protein